MKRTESQEIAYQESRSKRKSDYNVNVQDTKKNKQILQEERLAKLNNRNKLLIQNKPR